MISIGERFAGYELLQLVGDGSTGAVYKARDVRLTRTVALRILAPEVTRDPLTRARLNRELTALASVDHPNVIPIYEAGEVDGRMFIASRWVEATTLSEMVREGGPLNPRRAVRIAIQIAAALHATHALGIIHRNVKPSKVLITPDADHIYLTDFGVARHSDDDTGLTVQEHLLESFDYVAPEYITGHEVDARADIYGLGCVLYESLTGEVPYPRDGGPAKLYAHQSAPPPSPRALDPRVPERLDALVRRALAKDPAERQQSAVEFAFQAAGAVGLSAPLWAARALAEPSGRADGDAGHQDGDLGALPSAQWDDEAPGMHPLGEEIASPGRHGDHRDGRSGFAPRDHDGLVAVGEHGGESDGALAGEDGASGFSETRYYLRRGRRARRILPWVLALTVFLAAPVALLVALGH